MAKLNTQVVFQKDGIYLDGVLLTAHAAMEGNGYRVMEGTEGGVPIYEVTVKILTERKPLVFDGAVAAERETEIVWPRTTTASS